MRRIAILSLLVIIWSEAVFAVTSKVFFVHGANVSEQESRVWASEMFKRLWQSGADMEFIPVSWNSNPGAAYEYALAVSNAFVTAPVLANLVNSESGRKVVIAHSLGTMVAASAIQDHGMQVDKFILLNSAIPSEAFDPSLADFSPTNHLVHEDWTNYTSVCWASRWHEFFPTNDARSRLTWRGRFADATANAVNFYSSGDEVLEIYSEGHNPSWYDGWTSPSGKGSQYAWQKQELWKGREGFLAQLGTTDWMGWGFRVGALGLREWSAETANAVADVTVFATNTVFRLNPASITNAVSTRMRQDFVLAQGIPALSPPTGRTHFSEMIMPSFDMNDAVYKPNQWPRGDNTTFRNRVLHSDIKDVAYYYCHRIFQKIVEEGGFGHD